MGGHSSDSSTLCVTCRKPGATLECGQCFDELCRSCAIFLDETTFAYRSDLPEELKHTYYCQACHQQHVEPALEAYNEVMERAREVYFFFEGRKHPVPVLRKALAPAEVTGCNDRDDTILRLGFKAAEGGFNAIVDAVIEHEKVRDHGWHKTRWTGKGMPAQVDAERLERQTGSAHRPQG